MQLLSSVFIGAVLSNQTDCRHLFPIHKYPDLAFLDRLFSPPSSTLKTLSYVSYVQDLE